MAHDLLSAELPASILQQIQSDSVVQSLGLKVQKQLLSDPTGEPKEVAKTLFHIRTRERWQDKLKSLIGLINHSGWLSISQNDRKFVSPPSYLFFLYYIIRPVRILLKYWD